MQNQSESNENDEPTEADTKPVIFVRGFLTRFSLGIIPIFATMLIRPDLKSIVLLAAAWFVLVCIMTAGLDVALGRSIKLNWRTLRLTPRVVTLLALLIASFVYLFVTR